MNTKPVLFFFANILAVSSFCQTYIKNVTVLDVEKQKLVPAQTVMISGDKIADIASSKKIKIPAGATIIDGTGKYLMPGLTDAHVHFFQSGGLYTRPDALDLRKYKPYEKEIKWGHDHMEDFLRRYLREGITTVIDPGSTLNFLKQRDTFANKSYAPSIYMTGPLLTTYEPEIFKNLKDDEPFFLVKTPEDGIAMVQKELPFHPDFIKIWYIIDPNKKEESAKEYQPIVKAIIEEAHKNNLRVAVHATEMITAQLAVESGCDYLVHDVEDKVVSDDFLRLLKSRNIVLCPTLIVMDGYVNTFGQTNNFSEYELARSNPEAIGSLYDMAHLPDTNLVNRYAFAVKLQGKIFAKEDSTRLINLKKMVDYGITIAAGTDAGNIGTQHATSLFTELKSMQKSGMTIWQILQSATINGAKALGKEKTYGSIVKGKTADMILLGSNPINNLENLHTIDLVFNRGVAINPDTLIKETPLALVERQLNAYNARNIDAFLEPYAEDVELYQYPEELLGKGKENMRKEYTSLFDQFPKLHCEIKERIVQGNVVIDKESVSIGNNNKMEATAIYEIKNNKIQKVYFIQ